MMLPCFSRLVGCFLRHAPDLRSEPRAPLFLPLPPSVFSPLRPLTIIRAFQQILWGGTCSVKLLPILGVTQNSPYYHYLSINSLRRPPLPLYRQQVGHRDSEKPLILHQVWLD